MWITRNWYGILGKDMKIELLCFWLLTFDFFMVLCLLYKDFSCIKCKNSKIDHLLGNQTKIFRSHEIHKIEPFHKHLYGHCDVSIKPSLAPSAVQLRKGEGVSIYMWNFLVFFSTWYQTKLKISKKPNFRSQNIETTIGPWEDVGFWGGS